jgi:phenylalanyl-tRNA synthetase alpha subunit
MSTYCRHVPGSGSSRRRRPGRFRRRQRQRHAGKRKGPLSGKTGALTELLKGLGKLDPEARKTEGARINQAKQQVEAALQARRQALADALMNARWPPKRST